MAIGVGTWVMLLTGVALNAGAQLLLKAGVTALGGALESVGDAVRAMPRIIAQPYILLGLSAYVLSFVLWIVVLSRVPVSVAYPMLALGFVANALLAAALFGEQLTATKIAGIGLIVIGVVVLARAVPA